MKKLILYLCIFFVSINFVQAQGYIFESEAMRLQKEINQKQLEIKQKKDSLDAYEVIPNGVMNQRISRDHNIMLYENPGDTSLYEESFFKEYEGFYRSEYHEQIWSWYDEGKKKCILDQDVTLVDSTIAWTEAIATFLILITLCLICILLQHSQTMIEFMMILGIVVGVVCCIFGVCVNLFWWIPGIILIVLAGFIVSPNERFSHLLAIITLISTLAIFWYRFSYMFFVSGIAGMSIVYPWFLYSKLKKKKEETKELS